MQSGENSGGATKMIQHLDSVMKLRIEEKTKLHMHGAQIASSPPFHSGPLTPSKPSTSTTSSISPSPVSTASAPHSAKAQRLAARQVDRLSKQSGQRRKFIQATTADTSMVLVRTGILVESARAAFMDNLPVVGLTVLAAVVLGAVVTCFRHT